MQKFRQIYFLGMMVAFFAFGDTQPAHASAALLLEEPYAFFGHMNPTGHAAVYLDHVCADSPTSLRRCKPGEVGVVISRYHRVDGYDWVAVPLIPYLYAVDRLEQIPVTATPATESSLRDAYRRKYLESIAPDTSEGETPHGEWIQLIGASYDRKIYGFQLISTQQQDDAIIESFNHSRNVSHFNLFFHNCADFSRKLMNQLYPKAIHRNLIADFGLTTPKQVAHSIARYGLAHPEMEYTTFIIPQVPGTIARSRRVEGVAESLISSKKYVVPMAILIPEPTAIVAAAWITGGRFRLPKEADLPKALQQPRVEPGVRLLPQALEFSNLPPLDLASPGALPKEGSVSQ